MRARTRRAALLLLVSASLALGACARGGPEQNGWQALRPGMELSVERGAGPRGEDVLALLYTIVTGQDYAVERRLPAQGLQGPVELRLSARATRVLHLACVVVDRAGVEHEAALTLLPGDWRELCFRDLQPPIDDWAQAQTLRLVDRTGGLGGQGPVSLKLVGMP
jgi:hypothetical protein